MGNASSVSQKVEQVIQNYTEANAVATAYSECKQNVDVDARGAIIMCDGWRVEQKCTATSNASLDTVVKALQTSELDSESEQYAEGLVLSMNALTQKNHTRTTMINELVANCQSNAEGVMDSVHHYDLRGAIIDCREFPDANVFTITQYNDVLAACVVKQIVDAAQENSSTIKNKQKNIGLSLPDFGACLGVIALVILAPMLMPSKKNNSSNLKNLLK